MFIVGMDAMPEALDAVRSGELMSTVDANNFWQGFVSTDLTCKYLLSKKMPAKDTKIGSGIPEVITKENLEKFINFKAERYNKYGLKPI
jgi:ABC-type sugar transport system substrate-binding protein